LVFQDESTNLVQSVFVKEKYAANTLAIGETVILPKGYDFTRQKIEQEGFEVITLEMSEFERCEGALTCLSLFID